jgi:hypothetical protein
MRWRRHAVKSLGFGVFCWALSGFVAMPVGAQQKAEANNMDLVGYNDLQGRSAFAMGPTTLS